MLTDDEIAQIVGAEERHSLGYLGEGSTIQQNRATLLDYYNQRPYGDEIDGLSKMVTSDVSDVVEGMLPQLLRIFTQGRTIGKFTATDPRYDQEAEEKTEYANWVFSQINDGVITLHDMFKDALLQYSGAVKVTWCDKEEVSEDRYENLDEIEVLRLKADDKFRIKKTTLNDEGLTDVEGEWVISKGRPIVENVPPDELLIARRARHWKKPPFIGQRTPRTRSELLEMDFDKKTVMALPKDEDVSEEVRLARNFDLEETYEFNPTSDASKDVIYLGEYYVWIDADEDGVSELWQIFYSNQTVLRKQRVDSHPFCVCIPVPMPHKAIGTCPADQVADLQYLKSTLLRQMLNNIYSTNFNRVIANKRVELDDLLTPQPGGVVRVDDNGPVGDAVLPMPTSNQVPGILQAIEYSDTMREVRTGVTRYNQGLDTESLNKTATGFQGIRDMSQMRIELIARIFADSGVKHIFEKIVELGSKYQDEQIQIRVHGQPLVIDPSSWKYKASCHIDVGIGSGERQEKIGNLNYLYQQQKELLAQGSVLTDQSKIYNTVDKLITELGLKDTALYFNNPEKPPELLQAENEQLTALVQQLEAERANPLVETEQIKQQGMLQRELIKAQTNASIEGAKLDQDDRHHDDEMAVDLTEIEQKYGTNIPGALS